MNIPKTISIPLLLAAAAFTALSLAPRWRWERDRSVEVCVDGEELAALSAEDDARIRRALEGLAAAGVSSVGVYADGPDLESALRPWAARLPPGLALTLRPRFPGFREPGKIPPAFSARIKNLLPAGPALPGFPDTAAFVRWAGAGPWSLPAPEFHRQAGLDGFLRRHPERIIRAHSIDAEEMERMSPAKAAARFRRAVRERGVRFLYVRFFPGLSPEANGAYAAGLAAALKADGFTPGPAAARRAEWGDFPGPASAPLRQAAAFLSACLLPVFFFRLVLRRAHPIYSPLFLAALGLGAALLTAAFLSTPDFALGLAKFRGVKAALALPLAAAFLALYPREELKRLGTRPLTVGAAALLVLVAAAGALYLLRSGHESFVTAGAFEQRFRGVLEALFGVRPRFKEFLIGHPLLWLGFYGLKRGWDSRPLLLAGLIGPLSIVNTFCHAHVPLAVSLERTFHGAWVGALVGWVLIGAVHWRTRGRRR